MRIRLILASSAIALSGLVGISAPANAASCSGFHGGSNTVTYKAFMGHSVRATYNWCDFRPKGFIGPVRMGIRGVYNIHITYPSRVPTGLGETLTTTTAPYLYSYSVPTNASSLWKYRFSTRQGHVGVPLKTNFDFELQVRGTGAGAAPGRICFVGKACSSWQNKNS